MNIPYRMPMNYFLSATVEPQPSLLSSLKRRSKKRKRVTPNARPSKKYKLFRGVESASEKLETYELLYMLKRNVSETLFLARSKHMPHRHVHIKQTNFSLTQYLDDYGISQVQRKRFKMEQRVLSRLRHPHISQLYETGLTEDGKLYFVSEAVNGKSLLSYCNEQRLDPHQRLALCASICEAIHYAHSKGIFHRAIYPSNILITKRDGKPWPMLVNLGATGYPGAALFTEQTAESRGYRAPDVASGSSDTPAFQREVAMEIYSLGALVHHLLVGVTPQEPPMGLSEATEQKAVGGRTPATRWKSLPAELRREYACERGVHERELSRVLGSDLKEVLAKALNPDPESRYLTAWDLAADLRSFTQDRPVTAHPRSRGYVIGKFLSRNKRLLITAAATAAWAVRQSL